MSNNEGRKRRNEHHRRSGEAKRHRPESVVGLKREFFDLIPLFTNFAECPSVGSLDPESRDIFRHFQAEVPSESEYRSKFRIWSQLISVFVSQSGDPSSSVMIFGSTLSGLARKGSDLDVCVYSTLLKDKITLLSKFRRWIQRGGHLRTREMHLIPAKVPILKFSAADEHSGRRIEIDISCNDTTGIRNSHLIFSYGKLDYRFKVLYAVLKAWASKEDINDAKNFTLSSFTLILMLIHFLQAGVHPPVLPVLHEIGPKHFSETLSESQVLALPYNPHPDANFTSQNSNSLRSLLKDFFVYYHEKFDFSKDVGSIRTGKRLDVRECVDWARAQRAVPRQWEAYVLMEEPFNRSNTARSTINRSKFDDILQALERGHRHLIVENVSLPKFLESS